MATLDVISELVQGSPSTPAREVIQGEQFILSGTVRQAVGAPAIGLADYDISAKVEFYLASVSASGDSLSIGAFVDSALADRTLTVAKTGTGFTILFPTDLYTETIEPAITVNVPVGVVFLTITNRTTTEVDIGRLVLVFRKGPA